MTQTDKHHLLKQLPGVDHLLDLAGAGKGFTETPLSVIKTAVRASLDSTRKEILAGKDVQVTDDAILEKAEMLAREKLKSRLVPLINGTGVVLHTNLGRALLCRDALDNIGTISGSYSNLELDIKTGKRGIRYAAVEELICDLTGAESAIAVNNNAGAVFLTLNTIAEKQEVVVSRGELVEIGGSFRVPDVMTKSGCVLKEVGTTNRTHLRDYENAVSENTGLFMKVHASNYRIEGFTKSVSLEELVALAKEKQIPVMEDLGSGTLIDFSKYGLPAEPTVMDSVIAGADVVTFSGDKLLGGPQAGIIVGKKATIDKIKKNPLTRALRIDKMTLAALEATLKLYRDEEKAIREIPTLRMLTLSYETLCQKAERLSADMARKLGNAATIELVDMNSRPGGGSFPELDLPTRCIAVQPAGMSVSRLEKKMRLSDPAVIGRIEDNRYILDPRTILDDQESVISSTLAHVLVNHDS